MLLHCLNQRTLNLYIYLCICVHFFSKKTKKTIWMNTRLYNGPVYWRWTIYCDEAGGSKTTNRDASPTIRQRRSKMSSRRTGNQKVCWYLEINNYCNTYFVLWVEYSRAAVQFVSCAVTSTMDWTYHDIYCVA